jgi:hypothetical protein
MSFNSWLPIGFELPDGAALRSVLFHGAEWQIYETRGGGRAIVAKEKLMRRWLETSLIEKEAFGEIQFGHQKLHVFSCGASHELAPVSEARAPDTKADALSFALALRATREADSDAALQDAIYVEKITRLLPVYGISSRTDDDVVLGYWLTGGASISVFSFRRLLQAMSWINEKDLKEVVRAAGFALPETGTNRFATNIEKRESVRSPLAQGKHFELAGRPALSDFFNEHVIDIVAHHERYKALGIHFPSAVILNGPPGCGKTFAAEKLVDFLGWPCFQIDASSVASPFIHETSKKIAQVFDKAIENAPSLLIIDEMEAFLADRKIGTSHYHVEEVAEFLRRIPEASKKEVLIIAMTNRLDMIDPAILRRGRFDHIVEVDFASETEAMALMEKLLLDLPKDADVDIKPLAKALAGRPLSDIAFVVREGARLAAHSGKDCLSQACLLEALETSPARECDGSECKRRIGFV